MGTIRAICISEKRGTAKHAVPKARCIAGWGLEGDGHGGTWHRQISLLAEADIDAFRKRGASVSFGDFGENLVVAGMDAASLPVGTLLRSGSVLLETTQIGKACHSRCVIYYAVGECLMPKRGVFARVLSGGMLREGDEISVEARRGKRPYQAAVITLSDKGSRGERADESGPAAADRLRRAGFDVIETLLLPDGIQPLAQELVRLADQRQADLIVTTGGTGFSPRDLTPEATLSVAERQAPGIAEAMRAASMAATKRAMLSRAVSVIRGRTLIINLPGSPGACRQCLDSVLDTIPHGLDVLRGSAGECAHEKEGEP